MSPLARAERGEAPEPVPETLGAGDPNIQDWPPVAMPVLGMEAIDSEAAAAMEAVAAASEDVSSGAGDQRTSKLPDQRDKLPDQVTRNVLTGTSAMGASVFLERGAGFLANILAFRLGGRETFGAYSLAINTATNISTYAAGGIGATAARFSGKYPRHSRGYQSLIRALAIVSVVSAAIAALAIWFGAGPIARLLHNENLTTLLRCAWISAAGVVLLECARGFLVGQRFVAALLTMSVTVGAGMVFLLPYAAHRHSPATMVELQGGISLAAVFLCYLLGKRFGWRVASDPGDREPLGPVLKEIWSFGLIQLAGLVGLNLSGWWATALVARGDTTLVQMSYLTIASQLRNLASLPPSLLTEGSYAVMADPTHEGSQTPQRVMALCTFAALSVSLLLGLLGIALVPWGLALLYGRSSAGAGAAVAVALATAVSHMGTAPASARLTIVSIRSTALINTLWAVFVAIAATVFLLHGGNAWVAMAIYFSAHALSSTLAMLALKRWDNLPHGLLPLFAASLLSIGGAAAISLWRGRSDDMGLPTLLIAAISIATGGALYGFGRRYRWLPPRHVVANLLARLPLLSGKGARRV